MAFPETHRELLSASSRSQGTSDDGALARPLMDVPAMNSSQTRLTVAALWLSVCAACVADVGPDEWPEGWEDDDPGGGKADNASGSPSASDRAYVVGEQGTCWAASRELGCPVESVVNCSGPRPCDRLLVGDRLSCGRCETDGQDDDVTVGPPETRGDRLDVPYYYQYDNLYEPGSTCGLTSAAMVIGQGGVTVSPDTLYRRYGKAQGQSPSGLAALYRAELGYGEGTTTGTRARIRAQIDAGRPVVIHGYFTRAGHVLVVIGYDDAGWIINDPAGRWAGCCGCGYPGRTSTNGRAVHYSYEELDSSVIGVDGDVWMSAASTTPFTL